MPLERMLLFIFLLGLGGTATELLVSGHTESALQWAPLILLGGAVPALALLLRGGSARAFEVVLWLFIVSSAVGVVLHNRAKMEFQLEGDRSLKGWALFLKSFESKNPPALAPGAMAQLGLIGLAYQAARRARIRKGEQL